MLNNFMSNIQLAYIEGLSLPHEYLLGRLWESSPRGLGRRGWLDEAGKEYPATSLSGSTLESRDPGRWARYGLGYQLDSFIFHGGLHNSGRL